MNRERVTWIATRVGWLIALAALAIGLTRSGRAPDDDVTELIYWGWSRGPELDVFEDQNPGVRVRVPAVGHHDDPRRLIIATAGGSPPDLVLVDRLTVGGYAARGAFMELDDFVAGSETIHGEDFFPAPWNEVQYDGHVYGVPAGMDIRALFYNKDLLEQAGLVDENGEAQPPRTWKELREYANILTVKDDRGRFEQVGFIPNYGNSWFYLYSFQNGGAFLSDDGNRCTFTSPENVEALQYMVDIYDDLGGIEKVDAFSATFQGEADHPFIQGKVAMYITGDWELNWLAKYGSQMRFGVAPAPVPGGREPLTWAGGWAWVIPRGAKNPELAFQLIEYLRGEEGVLQRHRQRQSRSRSRGSAYIPTTDANMRINARVQEQFVANNPNLDDDLKAAVGVLQQLGPVARWRPATSVGKMLWDEHIRAFERAAYHVDTPEEALGIAERRVQSELDAIADTGAEPVRWTVLLPILLIGTFALLAGVIVVHARRRRVHARPRATLAGYLFASPHLIGLAVFTAGPVLASFVLSLTRFNGITPARFSGLQNYVELVTQDPLFWTSLWNTAFMMLGLPLGLAIGLGIALLLERETQVMRTYRTIYYLPAVVPVVVTAVLWIWVLDNDNGLINSLLYGLGIENPPNWLFGTGRIAGLEFYWSKPSLIMMGLWGAGSGMIIWLAGLKGIPRNLYKAAAIDGAGPWQRFRHVTLPMLSPYIFFNLVMGVIGTMQIFTEAYIMTDGGPADSTRFYALYLFDNTFEYFRMGTASAMAWILFAIVLVLTFVQLRLGQRWVHYQGD